MCYQQFSFWIFSVIFLHFTDIPVRFGFSQKWLRIQPQSNQLGAGSRMRHEVQQLIPVVVEEAFPEHFQSLEIANTRAFALAGLLPQFAG